MIAEQKLEENVSTIKRLMKRFAGFLTLWKFSFFGSDFQEKKLKVNVWRKLFFHDFFAAAFTRALAKRVISLQTHEATKNQLKSISVTLTSSPGSFSHIQL